MSVLARNTFRDYRARGIASIFLFIGTVGAPFALLVLPFAAIAAGGNLGEDPLSTKALGSLGLFVAVSLGLLGWTLTILYVFAERMRLSAMLLMWSIHIGFNIALSVPWLIDPSIGDWPVAAVGVGYIGLALLAAFAGIRDLLDIPVARRRF